MHMHRCVTTKDQSDSSYSTDGQRFMAVSKQTLSSGDSVCLNPCMALCYNYNSHEVPHGFMGYHILSSMNHYFATLNCANRPISPI